MDEKDKNYRNFECQLTAESKTRKVHAKFQLSSTSISWEDKKLTISYKHIFLELNIEGALFDKYTLKNADYSAEENKVYKSWSENQTHEQSRSAEKINGSRISLNPFIDSSKKSAKSNNIKNNMAERCSATVEDLTFELEHIHEQNPKWKISQKNPGKLGLSGNNKYMMGEWINTPIKNHIKLSGTIRSDEDGFNIEGKTPGLIHHLIPPYENFKRRLFHKKISIDIQTPKEIEFILVDERQ